MKSKIKPVKSTNVDNLVKKKLDYFQDVIQRTALYVQHNKLLNIIGIGDCNSCINTISSLNKHINNPELQGDNAINILQLINNELSTIFKSFGTKSLEDLLYICFGNNDDSMYASPEDMAKFELLKKYFHPTGYKVSTKLDASLTCEEHSANVKSFYTKVHGMQLTIIHPSNKRGLIITGTVDDIVLDLLNNSYINNIRIQIQENKPKEASFSSKLFDSYIGSFSLKDYLVTPYDVIYSKFVGYVSQLNSLNQKPIHGIIKEFVGQPLFFKRNTIIMLLINTTKNDHQYLAYLLYDLMSNDAAGAIDTLDQMSLFDSLPHSIKECFRIAMKKTVQYTTDLSDFDTSKIPIEQQICLMNAPDTVKEKAMQKLKEVKSKSEDSCSKAKQYLDGLLKIPFGINRKEPILCLINEIKQEYATSHSKTETCTNVEIIKELTSPNSIESYKAVFADLPKPKKAELHAILDSLDVDFLTHTNKSKTIAQLTSNLNQMVDHCFQFSKFDLLHKFMTSATSNKHLLDSLKMLVKYSTISTYMKSVTDELDVAVYGHKKAKRQIEHIVAQWINGKQNGYCFGFEGPPGVGKTSLAKCGLSKCLKDENGDGRPFSMIQMGGDSNGSSLHGHNYTYVGSTWGNIVQILIDTKCMNPIIFIDEVDKISKTEHGREIVGILTHLLDPAQNDCFQDRYFTGIDLNLSNALFILSYNDAELIDPILLDRIHRIKFDSLSTDDKIIIANKHIIPDICDKMGLTNMIQIEPTALTTIIDEYTNESGVRKLKELLFEIIAEINLDILKTTEYNQIPIVITKEKVKTKYLKDKHSVHELTIHPLPAVGIMNGLWANSAGKGGIIPIQSCYFPSNSTFELKLTGMQGDVMKESMNVALTLAWKLTSQEKKDKYMTHKLGIHIHCPDGATPKDGPSAGACITTTIYSLLNDLPIRNTCAITGEINLQGNVTMIGGLQLKILGAIKAGAKEVIYPDQNQMDFDKFIEKYETVASGITFHRVKTIQDVFCILFS
jgi:endopeptidase La